MLCNKGSAHSFCACAANIEAYRRTQLPTALCAPNVAQLPAVRQHLQIKHIQIFRREITAELVLSTNAISLVNLSLFTLY